MSTSCDTVRRWRPNNMFDDESWLIHEMAVCHQTSTMLTLGLYSLSGKTSYRKISWSLEAARFGFKLFQWLWNLAGTSAALLPRCLSNFRAIRPLQHPISWLRDITRFGGKTSYSLVNRGPDLCQYMASPGHRVSNQIYSHVLYGRCRYDYVIDGSVQFAEGKHA